MRNRSLMVGIAVLVVLCWSASSFVWGEKCKEVVIGKTHVGPILYGPENCDGYDGCATSKISGTFSGTLFEAFYEDDFYFVVDDTYAFTNYGVIETKQGELFFTELSVADFAAPDGFAMHANVTGGTGRYEGATGWMAYCGNFEGTDIKWVGEVCWPDEE